MDINLSHREKMLIRYAMGLARYKIGKRASIENIHNELMNSDCTAIKNITIKVNEAIGYIKSKWQKQTIQQLSEFGLWIMYNSKKHNTLLKQTCTKLLSYDYVESKKNISWLDDIFLSLMLRYLNKELNEFFTFKEIKKEFITETNPAIQKLFHAIDNLLIRYLDEDAAKPIVKMMIWFCVHDTAYRDPFFWILHEIGNDEIKQLTKPYYKQPKEWYGNVWYDGKETTKEKRKNNELSEYDVSYVERLCVPSLRQKSIMNNLKKMNRGR